MTDLTEQEKKVMLSIILNGRYTPDEWEGVVKPIAIKLQQPETGLSL